MVKVSSFQKQVSSETERLSALWAAVSSSKHSLCDVVLRVPGSGADAWVSIGSNSAFLRAKSAVLDAMWQSDSSAKGVESIDIADCSEDAIRALNAVAFGQLDAVEITAENVAELLYAAMKYDLKLVVDCCQQFIEDVVAKDDVSQWLPVVSGLYKGKLTDYASKIAAKCKLFGSENTSAAFESDAVTTLPFSLFRDLLKDDALRLSEECIWTQCVKWAEHNCDASAEDLEDVKEAEDLGAMAALLPLKEHIRFPLMSLEFFFKNVATTKLLSETEIASVGRAAVGVEATDSLFCTSTRRIPCGPRFDLFDPSHFKVQTKGTKEVLRVTGEKRALFCSSKGWKTGVHKWTFTVDECNGPNFGFGVTESCEEFKKPSKALLNGNELSVVSKAHLFFGDKYHFWCQKGNSNDAKQDWVSYKKGDVISLKLDCNNWTLTAVHNSATYKTRALPRDVVYYPLVNSKKAQLMQCTVEFED